MNCFFPIKWFGHQLQQTLPAAQADHEPINGNRETPGSQAILPAGNGGQKMNEAVKDLVAEPVEIEARAVQQGDWIILYTGKEKMKQISKRELFFPELQAVACVTNCKK